MHLELCIILNLLLTLQFGRMVQGGKIDYTWIDIYGNYDNGAHHTTSGQGRYRE